METCTKKKKICQSHFHDFMVFSPPRDIVRREKDEVVSYSEEDKQVSAAGGRSTGGNWEPLIAKSDNAEEESQARARLCCDGLLFRVVRTPLVLAQGSDVSHHPATYVSPTSPSRQLRPPVLLMLLHTLCSAFSTVQVPQAPLLPQEHLSPSAFRYRAGRFRPAKARKATDR